MEMRRTNTNRREGNGHLHMCPGRDPQFTDRATKVAKGTVEPCDEIIKLTFFYFYIYCTDAKVVERSNKKIFFYFIYNFMQKS